MCQKIKQMILLDLNTLNMLTCIKSLDYIYLIYLYEALKIRDNMIVLDPI